MVIMILKKKYKIKFSCIVAVLFFLLITISRTYSQQSKTDLAFICNQSFYSPDEFSYYHGTLNNKYLLKLKSNKVSSKYNPFSIALKSAMYFYQHVVSEQLSKDCPYQVTCSNFGKLAIQHHGLFLGMIMTSDRLTRCSFFSFIDFQSQQSLDTNGKIIDLLCIY